MSKLHQILAVESDIEGNYKRICEETKKVLGKAAMFTGSHRKLDSWEENAPDYPEEHVNMSTTVVDRLEYNAEAVEKYFDVILQKEATNQNAVADWVVDGVTIGKALPATFLLAMEARLRYVRQVYEAIPTFSAGVSWEPAPEHGENVMKFKHPEENIKTKMQFKSQILVEPTDHHPAQIEKWEEQVPVGKFVKQVWAGLMTSADKSAILGRIDNLLQSVKKARQQANSVEAVKINVGKNIMSYISG